MQITCGTIVRVAGASSNHRKVYQIIGIHSTLITCQSESDGLIVLRQRFHSKSIESAEDVDNGLARQRLFHASISRLYDPLIFSSTGASGVGAIKKTRNAPFARDYPILGRRLWPSHCWHYTRKLFSVFLSERARERNGHSALRKKALSIKRCVGSATLQCRVYGEIIYLSNCSVGRAKDCMRNVWERR